MVWRSFFAPQQSDAIDAYSVDTGFLPIVVLHPLKNDYYRQRFDAAHELGHLVMHADAEPGNKNYRGAGARVCGRIPDAR